LILRKASATTSVLFRSARSTRFARFGIARAWKKRLGMASAAIALSAGAAPAMTAEERKVILASSLGTVFEWYDFYLYGSLAAIIGLKFFSMYDESTRNIFALLAFAAGFLVRPFGALVFGRLGDMVGRK